MTTTLVYKNINSFIRNVVMVLYMRERGGTAMIDITLLYIYPCFFDGSLIHSRFSARGTWSPPRAGVSTRWLLSEWLTAILSRVEKLPLYIYFLDAHTFSFSFNSRDSFPQSLVYPKTQLWHPVYEFLIFPRNGLNCITSVLLQGWLWH